MWGQVTHSSQGRDQIVSPKQVVCSSHKPNTYAKLIQRNPYSSREWLPPTVWTSITCSFQTHLGEGKILDPFLWNVSFFIGMKGTLDLLTDLNRNTSPTLSSHITSEKWSISVVLKVESRVPWGIPLRATQSRNTFHNNPTLFFAFLTLFLSRACSGAFQKLRNQRRYHADGYWNVCLCILVS